MFFKMFFKIRLRVNMENTKSMSQLPLSENEYTDGEIYKLQPGSAIWEALFQENWQNCSDEIKNYFLDRLQQPHHFSGTVVSVVRSQIELTYIPLNKMTGGGGDIEIISITLTDVARFI